MRGGNLYQPKKLHRSPASLLGCLSGGENLRSTTTIEVLTCYDLVGSAMLCCFVEFLKRACAPEIFDQMLTPARKIVSYAATDYLLTLVLSVSVACDCNVAINHLLRPYPQVARLLGMPDFPEQSSVSGFLHTLSAASLEELDNADKIVSFGRSRWKIENEGFNNQKTKRYNIEHANSMNYNAMKNHYLIAQLADMLRQLYE